MVVKPEGWDSILKKRYTVVAVIVLAAVVALSAYMTSENSAIALSNPKLMDSNQYDADLEFAGVADLAIRGYCLPPNMSNTCDLTVSVALSTSTFETNYGLATKGLTLRVVNSPFVQLAIDSGDNPGPSMKVSYGEDNSGLKFATVSTPSTIGGATWTYDFILVNPPIVRGLVSIDVVLDVQLVHTGFLGHDYNLEAEIILPTTS